MFEDEAVYDLRALTVSQDARGARLDSYISDATDLSRSAAVRLIEQGDVTVNGKTVQKNYKLNGGERIEIVMPEPEQCEALPEDIPLDIVYEDNDITVINKPSGMVVHPGAGNPRGTLVNALLWHEAHGGGSLSSVGGVGRPGIVHRIDKDTSGLLVVAKNDAAHISLSEQIKVHSARRVYYAVCIGILKDDEGVIDLPIGRNPKDRLKMAVVRDGSGRDAVTHYRVLERYSLGARYGSGFTLVECRLETGRTHQIRVHMAALGHQLLGDELYGGANNRFCIAHRTLIDGQCLHAGELELTHPQTHERMVFRAEMPENLKKVIDILRSEANE